MTNDPDQIREQIEETRGQLRDDVNALAENARPSTMVRHRMSRLKEKASGVRDRTMGSSSGVKENVMGKASDVRERTMDKAREAAGTGGSAVSSVGDAATAVPERIRTQTQGNPLVVGALAFGVGWLLGSLVRASEREHQASQWVKEQAQPVAQQATEMAKETAERMKEPAREAAQSVRESATGAAGAVREEAGSSGRAPQP